ncbi:GNAT family N-acetyltransferase [Xanthomonas populi]
MVDMDAKVQVAAPAQVLARKGFPYARRDLKTRPLGWRFCKRWMTRQVSCSSSRGARGQRRSVRGRYTPNPRGIGRDAAALVERGRACSGLCQRRRSGAATKSPRDGLQWRRAFRLPGDTGRAILDLFTEQVGKEGVIKRLEAVVMSNNVRMLLVALSAGFSVEGVRKNAVRLKTGMIDEYVIVKYFD